MKKASVPYRIARRQFVATAVVAGAACAAAPALGSQSEPDTARARKGDVSKDNGSLRLHVVASGWPVPHRDRFGNCFILEVGHEMLMVDCGPAATYRMARMEIAPAKVSHVFFTHHHFDHNADFPCFFLARWDLSRGTEPPLEVYGPPPTRSFVERLVGPQGVFFDDWNARIQHPVSQLIHKQRGGILPRPAPVVKAHDVGEGRMLQSDRWQVTAAAVHHVEPWLKSLAYRIDTPQGSVVFAGDCGDCPALRELAKGAVALVIACVYYRRPKRPYDGIITGAPEAADIAQACGVRQVILSHATANMGTPAGKERAIAEVSETFGGEVLFPDEMTTVKLVS